MGTDILQTEAGESASTLQAAAIGATAITIDDANWNTGWTNRKIRIGDESYDVASFGSTTTCTLNDGLIAALAGGETYIVFRDTYSLPSTVSKLLEIFPNVSTYAPLRRVSLNEMARYKSLYQDPRDYATHYAEVGTDSSGNYTVQLYPSPNTIYNMTLTFDREVTELSADADIPTMLPAHTHHLIEKRAKMYVYEYDRSSESIALAQLARKDYEGAVGVELTRARKHVSKMRLDPDIFPGSIPNTQWRGGYY